MKNNCIQCQVDISHKRRAKFCSQKCADVYRLQQKNIGKEGIDYIVCPICQSKVKQITIKHAKMHGFLTIAAMKEQAAMPEISCQKQKERSQGKNNSGYNHGGKLSVWSKNFKYGYDEVKHQQQKENQSKRQREHPELFKNNIEYWLKQANGDEVLARKLYLKFQVRDLSFFVERYGEGEGKKRHQQKVSKWMKSYKKVNFSKISQKLFDGLAAKIEDTSQIYYATFDREDMSGYVNKEYVLAANGSFLRPDFICLNRKKIIEFDGTYWHSAQVANPTRELERDETIRAAGFEVKHVKEIDFKSNADAIITECLLFLNS